jgi:myosin heavy subunit
MSAEELEVLPPEDQAGVDEWLESKGRTLETTEVEDDAEIEEAAPVDESPETEIAVENNEDETIEEPVAEEQPRISRAFSKVAQKERRLQKERAELQKLKEELKPFQEAKAAADSGDMMTAVNKVGWNYQDATKQVLSHGKPVTKNSQTSQLDQRLAKLESMEKQKQVDDYVAKLKNIVETDDKYELTRAQWDNAWPTILEMQKIVATESGTVKPEHEILRDVEDFYEEQTRSLASSAKMRKLLGQTDDGPTQDTPSESQRTRPRTLRNKVSASTPSKPRAPQTKRERLDEALAVFESSARG